jgi:Zn-dependent protease
VKAQIKLGQIFDIEIGLHYSWFVIALLMTLSLASHFSEINPIWGTQTVWLISIVTALLFFFSIVVHELSHAAVAKSRGLPVKSITLFALGGVAQIEKEPEDARTEFWVGLIGPITSIVIGSVCLGLAWLLGSTPLSPTSSPLAAMLTWLGVINIALAVFNLLPGYPLDGGRVLRGIIWWVTRDGVKATQIVSTIGQLLAIAFIVIGVVRFFKGAGIGGLWIAFIGWFLLSAASASQTRTTIEGRLKGITVSEVMTREFPIIDSRVNLKTFVEETLLHTGHRCFIVEEQGQAVGLVTPHEVKEVAKEKWLYKTVDDVMRPLHQLQIVAPETSLIEALEKMGREDVNQLPVLRDGHLIGVITRGHILQLLQTRLELQS